MAEGEREDGYSVRRRRAPGNAPPPSAWARPGTSATTPAFTPAGSSPPEPAAGTRSAGTAIPPPTAWTYPEERLPVGEQLAPPAEEDRARWHMEPGPTGRAFAAGEAMTLSAVRLRRVALGAAILYAAILFDVTFGGIVARIDQSTAGLFMGLPTFLLWFGGIVSLVGEKFVLIVLTAGVVVHFFLRGQRGDAAVVAVSVLSLMLVVTLAKLFVGRVRPIPPAAMEAIPGFLVPGSLSFPSGHASMAVLVWGVLLVALLARPVPGEPWRVSRRLVHLWVGLAAAAGLARLLFAVHWPSDVLGGWALGLAWLAATLAAWRHLSEEQAAHRAAGVRGATPAVLRADA